LKGLNTSAIPYDTIITYLTTRKKEKEKECNLEKARQRM
jgi:hypothetical protein